MLSACHSDPPLPLYGEWEEPYFALYHPGDSTNIDSIRHLSHSQHRLTIECAQQIDTSNDGFTKGGDFTLVIRAWHDSSYRNPARYWYTEYVKGRYSLNEKDKKIRFNGDYYLDGTFSVKADTSHKNYIYSIGAYKTLSDYYTNGAFLTLSLDDSTRSDINTFFQKMKYEDCR